MMLVGVGGTITVRVDHRSAAVTLFDVCDLSCIARKHNKHDNALAEVSMTGTTFFPVYMSIRRLCSVPGAVCVVPRNHRNCT